jgi:hypothetical protein
MIDQAELDKLSEVILEKIMSPMVDVIKDSVHVWSGRQQTTVDYQINKGTGNISIGSNSEVWGKVVNYVIIEEFRHPQIRGTAIPLIFSLIRQGILLGYQRTTTDATEPIR